MNYDDSRLTTIAQQHFAKRMEIFLYAMLTARSSPSSFDAVVESLHQSSNSGMQHPLLTRWLVNLKAVGDPENGDEKLQRVNTERNPVLQRLFKYFFDVYVTDWKLQQCPTHGHGTADFWALQRMTSLTLAANFERDPFQTDELAQLARTILDEPFNPIPVMQERVNAFFAGIPGARVHYKLDSLHASMFTVNYVSRSSEKLIAMSKPFGFQIFVGKPPPLPNLDNSPDNTIN
jgi:hypothetical protein